MHKCPMKCHQLYEHSQMSCEILLESACGNGHKKWIACGKKKNSGCTQCDREQKRARDTARKEADRQTKHDAEQAAHDARIASLDAKIAAEQEKQREHRLAMERARALAQKQQDLLDAQARSKVQHTPTPQPTPAAPTAPADPADPGVSSPSNLSALPGVASLAATTQNILSQMVSSFVSKPAQTTPAPPPPSLAEAEWQRQKRTEGAQNVHIDSIIGMIGLEKVKQQTLDLKAEVEASVRQGVSMKTKNLNAALLGNPGTGRSSQSSL